MRENIHPNVQSEIIAANAGKAWARLKTHGVRIGNGILSSPFHLYTLSQSSRDISHLASSKGYGCSVTTHRDRANPGSLATLFQAFQVSSVSRTAKSLIHSIPFLWSVHINIAFPCFMGLQWFVTRNSFDTAGCNLQYFVVRKCAECDPRQGASGKIRSFRLCQVRDSSEHDDFRSSFFIQTLLQTSRLPRSLTSIEFFARNYPFPPVGSPLPRNRFGLVILRSGTTHHHFWVSLFSEICSIIALTNTKSLYMVDMYSPGTKCTQCA